MNELQNEVNPKILALAEYLELKQEQLLEITEESSTYFGYDDFDYLILTSEEVDNEIESLVNDEIDFLQRRIDNDDFGYSYFYKVDEYSVRDSFDLYSIGTGDWDKIREYYIFKL